MRTKVTVLRIATPAKNQKWTVLGKNLTLTHSQSCKNYNRHWHSFNYRDTDKTEVYRCWEEYSKCALIISYGNTLQFGVRGRCRKQRCSQLVAGEYHLLVEKKVFCQCIQCQKHHFPRTSVWLWLEISLQISKIIYLDIISANERGDRPQGKGTFPRIKEEGTKNDK